jgi:hypothetical protein
MRARSPRYSDYHSFGDRVASERGRCVLVRSSLNARVVDTPHLCRTCVRVGGGVNNNSAVVIFISAYLPTGSRGEPYRCRLHEVLAQFRENFPRDNVVIGAIGTSMKGSWMLCCGVDGVPDAKTVWPRYASARVRGTCPRGSCRVIDHFIRSLPPIVGSSLPAPHYVFVDYSWDTSTSMSSLPYVPRLVGDLLEISNPIPIERGLRQGGPTPPILFNIFINDLFLMSGYKDWSARCWVALTCLTIENRLRVPGQLFADDTVGLAPSLDNMYAIFAHFSQWAQDHYVGFGVKICGVMALGRHSVVAAICEQVPPVGNSGRTGTDCI